MDYCAGGDLHAFVQRQHGNLISEDRVMALFVQLCLAMKHVHDRKLLHRDLKTQNVFLGAGGHLVKVGDFGVAKVCVGTLLSSPCCNDVRPILCSFVVRAPIHASMLHSNPTGAGGNHAAGTHRGGHTLLPEPRNLPGEALQPQERRVGPGVHPLRAHHAAPRLRRDHA
eukprot:1175493-Prorocentrum_minimum.AAC.1